jgi:hypothetical protein
MLNHYLTGSRVVMVGTCAVPDPLSGEQTPTDPTTVTFERMINGDPPIIYTIGDPEVTKLKTGVFACTVEVDTPGQERWRVEMTGACQAVAENVVQVLPSML